jgi:hypothetical protein
MNWVQPATTKRETWGAFVEHALQYGVTIELETGVVYGDGTEGEFFVMRKIDDTGSYHYPMPRGCTADRVLRIGRVMQACNRLGIPHPEDWPLTL